MKKQIRRDLSHITKTISPRRDQDTPINKQPYEHNN